MTQNYIFGMRVMNGVEKEMNRGENYNYL